MALNMDQFKNSALATRTMVSDQFRNFQEPSGRVVAKPKNYYNFTDKKSVPTVVSSSSLPTTLNNAVMDFKIDNNAVDQLTFPSLHMTLTNNTASASTLVCAPLWIKQVEVFSSGTQLANISGDDLYQQFFFLDRATYEASCSTSGLTTAYQSTGASVAPGASIILNLPLYYFFRACGIATSALKNPLLLKFYFNPTTLTNITNVLPMTPTKIDLICRGKDLGINEELQLKDVYSEFNPIPVSLPHLQVHRDQFTQNLSANQVLTLNLTAQGVCSFIVFTVRLASDSILPVGQINYQRMQDFDILNNANHSLIGSYRRDLNVQQIDYALAFGNSAWNSSQFQIMSFASDPRDSFRSGNCSGRALLQGSERLSITVPSGFASASYNIEVKSYLHMNLLSEKGILRLERI